MTNKCNTYLQFKKGKQTEFLRLTKSNLSLTWIKVARILNVNRSMIYFYLNEDSMLPYTSYLKLCELSNLNSSEFEYKAVNLIDKGQASIPRKITPELAEFVGMILGDGSISTRKYQICITLNSVLEEKYMQIVKKHFTVLFEKEPSICYSKNAKSVRGFIYSKNVYDFLTKRLGLPNGKRTYKGNNVIPDVFFKDNLLLKSVIRGVFDTEGGFYQHNKTSPRLYIYNRSEALLDSIYLALIQMGYNAIKKKRWIKVCRKGEIKRFFNEICPNNLQKQLKYQIWSKEGKVPNRKRIIEELVRL